MNQKSFALTTSLLAFLFVFGFSSDAHSLKRKNRQSYKLRKPITTYQIKRVSNAKTWAYLGYNFGMFGHDPKKSSSMKNGRKEVLGLKFNIARHIDSKQVIDMGAGFFKSGDDTHTVPYVELAWRYKFLKDRLQVGPITSYVIGNRFFTKEINMNHYAAVMLGGQVMTEFPVNNGHRFRAGVRLLTDVNFKDTNAYWGGVDFQVGLPLTKRRRLVFDDSTILMHFDKANLNQKSEMFLNSLVKVLKKHKSKWTHINIGGHTDTYGSFGYNKNLSKKRASVVANYLVKRGIPRRKIRTNGFSYSKPVVEGESISELAPNRRAKLEIEIFGKINNKVFRYNGLKKVR